MLPGPIRALLAGPRAVFLPGLVAILFYWPCCSYWQSDDFFALTYAARLDNVLHDFLGTQYSLPPLVRFYRPLITLSFGIDAAFFGRDPFGAHLQNALVHGLDSMLVFALAARIAGRSRALPAAILWALAPSHVSAVLWSVGRVDTHSAFWYLLGLLLCLTQPQRGNGRALVLVVLALGLMTKEVMLTFPAAAFVLVFATASRGTRLRAAARATWPLLLLLCGYLLVRRFALGTWVGGYVGEVLRGGPLPPPDAGFGAHVGYVAELSGNVCVDTWHVLRDLLDPLSTAFGPGGPDHPVWSVAGGVVAGACLVLGARSLGGAKTALCLVLTLVLALPVVPFLKSHSDVNTLRYYYLPLVPLLLLAAGAPRPAMLALLAAFLVPLCTARLGAYPDAFREISARHRAALAVQPLIEREERAFFGGLEHMFGHCIAFHEGADAILDPPFGTGNHRANPFRPVVVHANVRSLAPEEIAFPLQNLFRWSPHDGSGSYVRVDRPRDVPRFAAAFTGPALIDDRFLTLAAEGKAACGFTCGGRRAPSFRVTLFTGQGYMTVVLTDRAAPDSADGFVDFRDLMVAPLFTQTAGGQERSVPVLDGVLIAVGVDREKVFPLIVEALDERGSVTAAASSLLSLTFDDSYVTWYLRQLPAGTGWVFPVACLAAAAFLCTLSRLSRRRPG